VPALPVGMADFRAPTRGAPTLWHRRPARDRHGQDGRATIWLRLRRATLPGSAAMYTEGRASRPPTAKGLADIGVQENEVCTRVVTQGPLSGAAAFPALRVLAAPPNPRRGGKAARLECEPCAPCSLTTDSRTAPTTGSEIGDPALPFPARRILERKIRHNAPILSKFVGIPPRPWPSTC
jgi:hypothetical protein